jgi:hypothetical protein
MNSALLTLLTTIEYQILLAPNGDIGNLQEIDCNSYSVIIGIGGGFTKVINNVTPLDDYYMRIRKRDDLLGIELTTLINSTTITMTSVYDASLSINEASSTKFKIVVNQNIIKLLGNNDFDHYDIYSLDGKQVFENKMSSSSNMIDISGLNKGIYVLNLKSNRGKHIFKFIKY